MSQVLPDQASPIPPGKYVILDTPDITPLGHVLRLLKEREEVAAVFVLRHAVTSELISVVVTEFTEVDHEREEGAIFFDALLPGGRKIEAFVFATPPGKDREVLGWATVTAR